MALVDIVCGMVEDRQGRFLLVLEKEHGDKARLKFPTEHLKPGESPLEALRRGLSEETSYTLSGETYLGGFRSPGFDGDELMLHGFYAKKSGGRFVESDEIGSVVWVGREYLRAMMSWLKEGTKHYRLIGMLLDYRGV